MITLNRFDWEKGCDVPFKVNEKAVEKFVNFMLNSKAWHDDLELIHKKVRQLRADAPKVDKPKETRQGAQAAS